MTDIFQETGGQHAEGNVTFRQGGNELTGLNAQFLRHGRTWDLGNGKILRTFDKVGSQVRVMVHQDLPRLASEGHWGRNIVRLVLPSLRDLLETPAGERRGTRGAT